MDRNLALELVRVTEAAALSSARFYGRGDPEEAEKAAVSAMSQAIKSVKMSGRIVIGEDEAGPGSTLCCGDSVGDGVGMEVDVVLDALESTRALANGGNNAISTIALGIKGSFKKLDQLYMRKLAVGPGAADSIDLNASVFDNLVSIAEAKRLYVEDLTVSILDRDRHRHLIEEVRRSGARIELIKDGDLAAAIAAALPDTGIDVMMGTGRVQQGIIAAAALGCIGGGFQCQLKTGEGEYGDILALKDIVGNENIMFAATGVSHSDFLEGVMFRQGGAVTNSVVFRSKSGTIRHLKTEHFFDRVPDYS